MNKNTYAICTVILLTVLAVFLYTDSKLGFSQEYLADIAYGIVIFSLLFLFTYQVIVKWGKK
mgnify:FL=1